MEPTLARVLRFGQIGWLLPGGNPERLADYAVNPRQHASLNASGPMKTLVASSQKPRESPVREALPCELDATTTGNAAQSLIHVKEGNFGSEVLESKQPVFVAFWAPWSQACRVLDSVLPELASALEGKAKVSKVNADDCLDLSVWYDVQFVPTLLYLVEGIHCLPCLRVVGAATTEATLSKLKPFGVLDPTATPANGDSGAGRAPGKRS